MKYLNLNVWLNYLSDSLCGSFDSKAKLLVAEFLIAWNGLFLPLYRMIIITVMIIIITLTLSPRISEASAIGKSNSNVHFLIAFIYYYIYYMLSSLFLLYWTAD